MSTTSFEPDVVLLWEMASWTTVSQMLAFMRASPKWRRLMKEPLFWRSMLESKPLRDMLFHVYDEYVAHGYYNTEGFPLPDDIFDRVVRYFWALLSERHRTRLFAVKDPFVVFMYVWTLFPHLVTSPNLQFERYTPTSLLATPLRSRLQNANTQELVTQALDAALLETRAEDFFEHSLTLPYVHFEWDHERRRVRLVHWDERVPRMSVHVHYDLDEDIVGQIVEDKDNIVWEDDQNDVWSAIPLTKSQIFLERQDGITTGFYEMDAVGWIDMVPTLQTPEFFLVLLTDPEGWRVEDWTKHSALLFAHRYGEEDQLVEFRNKRDYYVYDHTIFEGRTWYLQCRICQRDASFCDPIQGEALCGEECQKKLWKKI